AVAKKFLPALEKVLTEHKVELRGCEKTRAIISSANAATEEDWETEYLAPILSIKVVSGLDEAIAHINEYGSQHTDSIMTEDHNRAMRFLREVDSSSVMINAST
ncbi:MAG: aldehyde dehydrogenase family protein, partial [Gimesia chilikensis]